jgi:hypothetical protein
MTQNLYVKLNSGLPWHEKSSIHQEVNCFHQQIGLKFKEETSEVTFGAQLRTVLRLGHFGKEIGNTWNVLKFGVEEGQRSLGPIVCEMQCVT